MEILGNGQGTQSIKMGADKLVENTPNTLKFVCPSPKVRDFDEKRLHWASAVRETAYVSLSIIC